MKLLYEGASVLLKVGGGLSHRVMITKGIRQDCPISAQLYSLAIKPLLCKLRAELQGLSVQRSQPIVLSRANF